MTTAYMATWQIHRDTEQPQEKKTSQTESRFQFSWRQCQQQRSHKIPDPIQKGKSISASYKKIFSQKQIHPFSHQQHQYYQTSQIKLGEFSQHSNYQATSCPSPQCLVDQSQVQKPILFIATDQMPDHIQSREQYHQIAIFQVTSSGRSLMYSRKTVRPRMDP